MDDKHYSLHARPSKRSRTGEVYYVQFKRPDGSYSNAKSTGKPTKGEAHDWVLRELASGQVLTKGNVTFGAFAKDFFDPAGEYARHRRIRRKAVSERSLHEQAMQLKRHIMPYFEKVKLTAIDYDAVAAFQLKKLDEGISGSYVNKLTGTLRAILEHAQRKKLIRGMPLMERVGDQPQERGVLEVDEVKRLFTQVTWPDYRCYVANLTAAFTGLRQGEIIALRRQDVNENHLHVRHSYNEVWGLKDTKTRRVRNVALIPFVRHHIGALLDENPFKGPTAWVFYSHQPDKPMLGRIATEALYEALIDMQLAHLSKKERKLAEKRREALETIKTRRIDFHSHRHFFNSLLINNGVSAEKVRSLTGHTTHSMTERYYHAGEFQDVVQVLGRLVAEDSGSKQQ